MDDNLRTRLLTPLSEEIRKCFSTLADINEITIKDEKTFSTNDIKLHEVTVFQNAIGEVCGRVCLSMSKAVAVFLGSRVLAKATGEATEEKDITPDIEEAIKETLNIILGNATKTLENDGLGIIFEAPMIELDAKKVLEDITTGVSLTVELPQGMIELFYLIN